MIGTYRVYKDGLAVAESKNIITSFGKTLILKYLAGNVSSYAGALAAGIGLSTPSLSDNNLEYELFRVPIIYKTVNPSQSTILFKGTAGVGISGTINEIGLLSSMNNGLSGSYQTATIFEFDGDESWDSLFARDIVNSRIGTSAATLTAIAGSFAYTANTTTRLDLSGYSATDTFKLAMITYDTNCAYITLRFINAVGAEMSGIFVPNPHTAGNGNPQHQILGITKNQFSNLYGDWSNIIRAEVIVTAGAGNTQVSLDGLKVVDSDNLNVDFGLVSRSILPAPVQKQPNQTIDIEYSLEVPV